MSKGARGLLPPACVPVFIQWILMLIVHLFSEDRNKLRMENKLSNLESMVVYDLMVVLKYLNKKDKGALRASSTTLRRRIDELEKTFKIWRIHGEVDSVRLRRLSDEICTIQELAIYPLITPGCGPVFNYLVEKHKELESISIEFVGHEDTDENKDQDEIVLTTLSHNNLKSITIYGMKNTGDITGRLPSTYPNLVKLQLTDWHKLSDKGLMKILRRYRSNLRELKLDCSNITGVGIKRGVKSLPNLESLTLISCSNLENGELVEILSISGSKLRYLDVSYTSIPGLGLDKIFKSLPNLETLIMNGCKELSNRELLEILSIPGSKLRYLDVSWTSITGVGFKNGVKSLPMLENLWLAFCDELTEGGLLEILSTAGNRLKTVHVNGETVAEETLRIQYPSIQFNFVF
ncbi:uncharacterized protein LOC111712217 [Eurytemora carolleeae]|uniref:uncharacterized protein LOC111712217 n=1 Tax=Eurytemora carolleeae TaxID=1294199 RepID=UPI000C78ED41|nr:uncharacterized protein LOC111712217 [Eurytemora carolleeae]|eukprot:XP_023342546.1 uncharacterized protein LOC111712217 [Eurytemora affinis]